MNAHDTPSGTRMMWKASVKAIWDRAHGTGFTAATVTRPARDSFATTDPPRSEAVSRLTRSGRQSITQVGGWSIRADRETLPAWDAVAARRGSWRHGERRHVDGHRGRPRPD